ncbi:MAG: acetate kinase [Coriobacteriaceae bacterium]|nr:acetate kinase [Coriobacteriaceae bacterium]
MYVLVINAGSSSLKYQVIDSETEKTITKGLCERVGYSDSFHKLWGSGDDVHVIETPMHDHLTAMRIVIDTLVNDPNSGIDTLDEIGAVGYRIVHGGEKFSESVLVDDQAIADIELCSELAPLHNPPAVKCIRAARELMPNVPHVCVFDTAFHQTMPPRAYMYALPYEFYEHYGIRKYGAHGTSHRYIAMRTAEILGERLEDLKLITCHLGGGCSVTAIDHGMSVDTSMGFTPLGGVMMGSRCGDIDPSIVTYLMEQEGYTPHEINEIMNRESGLLGISGLSSDLRDIKAATIAGHKRATLAYDMYSSSVKKTLGAYIAELGGVDAISFAGGVGEHCERMRRMILSGMESLGIIRDYKANKVEGEERVINDPRSKVKLLVVPTNEELMIARDTARIASEALAQEHA